MEAQHSSANAVLGLLPGQEHAFTKKSSRAFRRKLAEYVNTKTCRSPLIHKTTRTVEENS